jgi:hypothetical protein
MGDRQTPIALRGFAHMRARLSFANVMSVVAVFIALGAGAYAAGLKKNSVGSKQIKANAVKSAEIADGAVGSTKLGDAAVTGAKLGDGSVSAAKLAPQSVSSSTLVPGLLAPSCPAGMTLFGRTVCVDTVARATSSWAAAYDTCTNAGLRLPSQGEIWLARSLMPGTAAWTEVGYREGGTDAGMNIAIALESTGSSTWRLRVHSPAVSLSVHCAAPPGVG